ncbi:histidine kinase dimerization/phosphoacceptor domain -containing protein [Bosea sp. (in: a-proteobacteria)]|uniref:histidine kinase dimerization/phosphoacceptor domain -containing protein n=1 Tax=Bosea sp. (in: a-proteobacteria) TaxID=1871050 RepID=UPI003B3BC73B
MRLARFSTVRGRLLALLIAIALPIACVTALAAATAYRSITDAIAASQVQAADDFAVRTRIWYRGALRSLLSFGAGMPAAQIQPELCRRAALAMLAEVRGYEAVLLRTADGRSCAASRDGSIPTESLQQTADRLRQAPPVANWGGVELAQAHYGDVSVGGRRLLAVHAMNADPEPGELRDGLLLVDPQILDSVFDLGHAGAGMSVALLSRGGGVVASRGEFKPGWLPADEAIPDQGGRWTGRSRDGTERVFAARLVAEPGFYVIAGFDDTRGRAARLQFAVLLLAPLLTLALLGAVYLRALDKHCLRWLRGIESAARSRGSSREARAAVGDDMPSDIRSVAEAFNTMVSEQEVRQRRLQTALDDNRFLVRELHHRVKNSLQVVQSYIGLSKRDYHSEARLALADAECRVHVLSAAYRFTLADGEMQPVRVDLFLEDVVTMISNLIATREQSVTVRIETEAVLSVDRIIPLGFVVADVASRVLRSSPIVAISVSVVDIDAETIDIHLEADREIAHREPPRLFAGLLSQIQAVQSARPQGRDLGRWRVRHDA